MYYPVYNSKLYTNSASLSPEVLLSALLKRYLHYSSRQYLCSNSQAKHFTKAAFNDFYLQVTTMGAAKGENKRPQHQQQTPRPLSDNTSGSATPHSEPLPTGSPFSNPRPKPTPTTGTRPARAPMAPGPAFCRPQRRGGTGLPPPRADAAARPGPARCGPGFPHRLGPARPCAGHRSAGPRERWAPLATGPAPPQQPRRTSARRAGGSGSG